jgi:hypothetical protein
MLLTALAGQLHCLLPNMNMAVLKGCLFGQEQYRIPDYFRSDFSMNIEGNHKIHQRTHNSFTMGVYNLQEGKMLIQPILPTERGNIAVLSYPFLLSQYHLLIITSGFN